MNMSSGIGVLAWRNDLRNCPAGRKPGFDQVAIAGSSPLLGVGRQGMTITNQKNFLAGMLYIVLGAMVAIGATGYELGTANRMGPGYFPFGLGLALIVTGICVVIGAFAPGAHRSLIGRWHMRNLFIVLLSVVLFGVLLEPLGLVIAIPVLLGISSLAHPDFSLRAVFFSTVFLLLLTWVVFILLLGLQIPLLPSFVTA